MSAPIRLLYGLIAGCLFAVFLFGGQMATLYTDWVWFEALSFGVFSDNLHVTLWVGICFGGLVLRLFGEQHLVVSPPTTARAGSVAFPQ